MDGLPPDQHGQEFPEPRRQQSGENVSDNSAVLVDSLNQLSINCTEAPASPASAFPPSPRGHNYNVPPRSPTDAKVTPSPLRRTSSNLTRDRSRDPELSRRASSSSLRARDPSLTPRRSPSRRSSLNPLPSPSIGRRSPLPPMEEAIPLTAASVAAEHFQKELALHGQDGGLEGKTIVILHDQCYGHRFSRPKTSKAHLSMIVERPERIHAGILGISTAYVRLGERHAGGRHAPHPARSPSPNLPFEIRRTSRTLPLTAPSVVAVHGQKWMIELRTMCDAAGHKLATTGKELTRTDNPPGQPPKEKFHEGDLYLCTESLNAFQGALGGVCDGVDAVFASTRGGKGASNAFVCVRPPGHHCSADYPSGFCWLNNVHVGIQYAAQTYGLTHAAIIDFDLHHGDGSQAITWAHNAKTLRLPKNHPNSKKTTIGYFSLHDINSYPCEYGDEEKVQNASLCIENAHNQNIWNVHLQPWKTEKEFWGLYEDRYLVLVDKARAFLRAHTTKLSTEKNQPKPLGAIFFSAGFDASEWESEGMQRHKVNVPTEFYARFTRDVIQMSKEDGLGVGGRVISVLEGGYSNRALASGILSHISGLCESTTPVIKTEEVDTGLGFEMGKRMGMLSVSDDIKPTAPVAHLAYDTAWWDPAALTALETVVYPAPAAPPPKKPKSGPQPTYQTPTQSFTAKVLDPERVRRNASSTYRNVSASPSRAPTPPPPEVDWATAAHELSKLLIPTDRQTKSCLPEELAEVRVKKERHSTIGVPAEPAAPSRQLRGRRAKVPNYVEPASDDDTTVARSVSRSDRRKTMGDVPLPAEDIPGSSARRSSRRLSSASTISAASTATTTAAGATSRATKPAPSNVQAKKPRVPAATKLDATKPRSGAEPPVPRAPPSYGSSARSAAPVATQSKPATASSTNDEMDALTAGVQRIRIKMPSAEEYAARELQKAKEEAEKKRAAAKPVVRRPAAPRTTKAGPATKRTPAIKDAKATLLANGIPLAGSSLPAVSPPLASLSPAQPIVNDAVALVSAAESAVLANPLGQHISTLQQSTSPGVESPDTEQSQPFQPPITTPPATHQFTTTASDQPSLPATITTTTPPAPTSASQPSVERPTSASSRAFEFHNSFPPATTSTPTVSYPQLDHVGSPVAGQPGQFPMGLQWQPVNADVSPPVAKKGAEESRGA